MIKMSAIMVYDGEYPTIITDKRHAACLSKAKKYGIERLACVHAKQGFLNEFGVFLDRKDAAKEAFRCGQIKEQKYELLSEDIWI